MADPDAMGFRDVNAGGTIPASPPSTSTSPNTTTPEAPSEAETVPGPDTATNNKYVGAVLPNVLDFYDSPTYVATLYMIPPVESSSSSQEPEEDQTATDGKDKRGDNADNSKGSKTKKLGGGFLNGALKATPENTVILASTGATAGITIDNIELVTVSGGPNSVVNKTCEFEIIQPGAASFPDMITRAQTYLGIPTETKDFPMFLEISFKGRTETGGDPQKPDYDDIDGGGEIVADIVGPFIYKLALKQFSINIDQTGSRYQFDTVITDEYAYSPQLKALPILTTTVGSTITEHIKGPTGLEVLLNDQLQSSSDKNATPDIIEFDLSGLVAAQQIDPKEKQGIDDFSKGINLSAFNKAKDTVNDILNTPNPVDRIAKQVRGTAGDLKNESKKQSGIAENLIIDETLSTTETTSIQSVPGLDEIDKPNAEELEKIIEENKSSGFVNKVDTGKIELVAKRGLGINEYFEMLLSMNDEFFTKISKVINPGEPFVKEDQSKTSTYKLSMNYEVVELEYNPTRRKYVKKIIYKPVLVKTQQVTALTSEGLIYNPEQMAKAVKEMQIKKAYHYLFTGRNDQIVNLDINYNKGLDFLIPVAGGMVGDPVLNTRHSSSVPVPASEDSNAINELFDKVEKVKDAKKLFDLFKGKDDILGGIAGILGFDSNTAKNLLNDINSSSAKAFAGMLQDKVTRESISNLLLNKKGPSNQSGTNTESDNQRIVDGSEDYTPTPSGYVYGVDLLGGSKHAEELLQKELAKRTSENVKESEAEKVSSGPVAACKEGYTNSHVMGAPQKSNRNSLMAYLFQQQNSGRFLVDLNMVVRGDPWYLGQPNDKLFHTQELSFGNDANSKSSDADGITTSRKDNFLLLEINTPRYFDLNVKDEDSNTGKWYSDGEEGTAYFFSGVYRIFTATCRFQNGVFTVDVAGAKETAIDISQLKPMVEYDMTLEEKDFLRDRQSAYQSETDSDKNKSPAWINGYFTGDRIVAGIREGDPVTLQDLLERGIINSDEAAAYESWQRDKGSN